MNETEMTFTEEDQRRCDEFFDQLLEEEVEEELYNSWIQDIENMEHINQLLADPQIQAEDQIRMNCFEYYWPFYQYDRHARGFAWDFDTYLSIVYQQRQMQMEAATAVVETPEQVETQEETPDEVETPTAPVPVEVHGCELGTHPNC